MGVYVYVDVYVYVYVYVWVSLGCAIRATEHKNANIFKKHHSNHW